MIEDFSPAFIETGIDELLARAIRLGELASPCRLCPRECGSLRSGGENGYCRTGFAPMVSSVQPHFGEEAPLVGEGGSGTVFLTNCNLGCSFCQNSDISHLGRGRTVTVQELADSLLTLQKLGCRNINFVTPTHQIHAIVEAVALASANGLSVPLVYNTGGYDSVETLRLLEGVFDIFMPDLKFFSEDVSADLAGAIDYPRVVQEAIREMHRQVGDLELNCEGLAVRGLIVRHLVLPCDLAGTDKAFRFLAQDVSRNTYLNVMAQYHPSFKAFGKPGIGSSLSRPDYLKALALAKKWGLDRLD